MRAVIIYRKNTDYEREVTDFVRDFGRRTGKVIDGQVKFECHRRDRKQVSVYAV